MLKHGACCNGDFSCEIILLLDRTPCITNVTRERIVYVFSFWERERESTEGKKICSLNITHTKLVSVLGKTSWKVNQLAQSQTLYFGCTSSASNNHIGRFQYATGVTSRIQILGHCRYTIPPSRHELLQFGPIALRTELCVIEERRFELF
jgi:hypothetical protein